MEILTISGEILPVIGTIGLLGLWFYQQKEIEKRANLLRQISSARGVFQTYQSNNALFNAFETEVSSSAKKNRVEELRRFQMYNYELGLSAIEEVLSDSEKVGIPLAAENIYILNGPEIDKAMDNVQERLGKLQIKLADKEKLVKSQADRSKQKYLWWYIGLSVISVIGAICKVADKLLQ